MGNDPRFLCLLSINLFTLAQILYLKKEVSDYVKIEQHGWRKLEKMFK